MRTTCATGPPYGATVAAGWRVRTRRRRPFKEARDGALRKRRVHYRRRHYVRDAGAKTVGAASRHFDRGGGGRTKAFRPRQAHELPPPLAGLRREPLAGRFYRGPGGERNH